MKTLNYKFGHNVIIGNPSADWSHAASYLAGLNKNRLEEESPGGDHFEADRGFRERLIAARGVDGLDEEDRARAADLAEADGVDIEQFPGGAHYQVSLVSDSNPLGLPGDLWALVTDASEGALVAALVRLTTTGELEVKWPEGHDWEPLDDLTVISDYSIVGVTADAISLFKNYDRDNNLGVIGSYPLSDRGPFPSLAQLEVPMSKEIMDPREEDDEYWENAGESYEDYKSTGAVTAPITASVLVNSEDDLPLAIAAALRDEDLRWYVERRIEALGLEADLPWAKD